MSSDPEQRLERLLIWWWAACLIAIVCVLVSIPIGCAPWDVPIVYVRWVFESVS